MELTQNDLQQLRQAKKNLENVSLAMKAVNFIGKPIEFAISKMPDDARNKISQAARFAMEKAVEFLVTTFPKEQKNQDSLHKAGGAVSGAFGGAFGLPGLLVELPVSTLILLRSILDAARSEGADLSDPKAQVQCLQVFALGGRSETDDALDNAYYAARIAMARMVGQAAEFIAERGLAAEGAPIIVQLISKLAQRYSIVVSEKIVLQAFPLIGAVAGAGLNLAFVDHFQTVAHGHFAVLRLEKKYGAEIVQRAYEQISI